MLNIPIILLAAGRSERMGSSKALLPWGKVTLIEDRIQEFIGHGHPLIVVLGSLSETILPYIEKYSIDIVINKDWQHGIASSIIAGIDYAEKNYPIAKGVMITLLDQALVTKNHLEKMLMAFEKREKSIVVSQDENGWQGVPALFDRRYFNQLKTLSGDKGAQSIIKALMKDVKVVDSQDDLSDIDTWDEYLHLLDYKFKK